MVISRTMQACFLCKQSFGVIKDDRATQAVNIRRRDTVSFIHLSSVMLLCFLNRHIYCGQGMENHITQLCVGLPCMEVAILQPAYQMPHPTRWAIKGPGTTGPNTQCISLILSSFHSHQNRTSLTARLDCQRLPIAEYRVLSTTARSGAGLGETLCVVK